MFYDLIEGVKSEDLKAAKSLMSILKSPSLNLGLYLGEINVLSIAK